ncbi:hypothetical protein B0J15DRAFT_516041 [Fusarium solani]|uniref:NmrA-like domain-containing protein n=1 Tax=Fusarium solani TaxID=169388 RepID=A0A9P9GJD3_FUSSL|nr:uncharacterized protein B0J15DRAFT_516041 [Fusarium solani]KAH7240520.1 hypothetical protein B0J15DRAFT_516041 [Fusarium solani]
MVKIAIAGASGQLAREILDGLVDAGRHEIVGLVRKNPSSFPALSGVQWVQTNYEDTSELVRLLSGVHTVLCFFIAHKDSGGAAQKRLIDAAVDAGVKRYAASEWSIGTKLGEIRNIVPWYASKLDVRTYLQELNRGEKVLEYTLFHPGLFMNYLGYPHSTTKHLTLFPVSFDFKDMYAIADQKHLESKVTYTAVEDIVAVVVRAVEYKGEWPTVGGMIGSEVTVARLLELGEQIRGKSWNIEWVEENDLQAGVLKTNWLPTLPDTTMADFPKDQQEAFNRAIVIGTLIATARGAWAATNEWNQLLPDYEFTGLETFLRKVWSQK